MKVKVTKECVCVTQSIVVNEGDYLVNKCTFDLPDCFNGLTVTAVFNNIPVPLTGNQCYVPSLKQGTVILGVYAYSEESDGSLLLRFSPKPTCFYVNKGSYSDVVNVEQIPSISEFERYCAAVSELTFPKSNIVESVDIEEQFSHLQVYSALALNSAFTEFSELFGQYEEELGRVEANGEKIANKVTTISENASHTQYPSAKAVYDSINAQKNSFEEASAQLSRDIAGVNARVNQSNADIKTLTDEQDKTNTEVEGLQNNIAELNNNINSLEEGLSQTQSAAVQLEQTTQALSTGLTELSDNYAEHKSLTQGTLSELANALKGEASGEGEVCIDDVSPVAHNVDVMVSGDDGLDMSEVVVECGSKNLLNLGNRVIADFNTTGHSFTGNNAFLSVAGSNYYSKNLGSYEFDEEKQIITYNCARGWYGLGVDVKVEPGETYIISARRVTEDFIAIVSFYDSDGKYITYISDVVSRSFTVPGNAEWMMVILTARTKDVTGEFEALQLEKGSVATEFCRFYPAQYGTPDSSGKIESFKSIAPSMIIRSHTPGVTLDCGYNRDIVKAFAVLSDAVKALGGTL